MPEVLRCVLVQSHRAATLRAPALSKSDQPDQELPVRGGDPGSDYLGMRSRPQVLPAVRHFSGSRGQAGNGGVRSATRTKHKCHRPARQV